MGQEFDTENDVRLLVLSKDTKAWLGSLLGYQYISAVEAQNRIIRDLISWDGDKTNQPSQDGFAE